MAFPESVHVSVNNKPGAFVLQMIFAEFTVLAEKKIELVLDSQVYSTAVTLSLISYLIIRSTCNSRDTLLSEALIYRLRGHYVGLRHKSGPIRHIRADIVTLWAISALI